MYKVKLILFIALIFLSFQSVFADNGAAKKGNIQNKLKSMGLTDSQINEVMTEIEEQQKLNQKGQSDEGTQESEMSEEEALSQSTEVEAGDVDATLPEIVVTGEPETPDSPYRINQDEKPFHVDTPDAGKLLMRIPGTNVNSNGPLTGIPQKRGQSNSSGRVNVLIDDMNIPPACTNQMDTSLSKISPGEIDTLEVTRGIAPVSSGIETFEGSIKVKSKRGEFGEDELYPQFHGEARAGINSVNDSGFGYVFSYLANANNIIRFNALKEDGDNTKFDRGEINPTEYERDSYTIGYSFGYGDQEVGINFHDQDEDETGTPSLPMDIISTESEITDFYYEGKLGLLDIEATLYDTDTDHEMNNYRFRDILVPAQRFAVTEATGNGYKAHFSLSPIDPLTWRFGFDGEEEEHNATIYSPNDAMFFIDNFRDASKDKYSGFTEWDYDVTDWLWTQLGFRYNNIEMDADRVNSTLAQTNPMVRILTDRFNNSRRNRNENEVDGVLKFRFQVTHELTMGFGVARKTRTPTYQERYLYIPLESTGGLADGRRYIGRVDLNTEINHKIAFDLGLELDRFYFRPNFFFSRVHDYIQGVPATDPIAVAVSTMNGDPNLLQYDNISAKYYGFDGEWGIDIHKYFRFDGIFSYVRGKRRGSIDDNLYRMPPFNAINTLTFHKDNYSLGVETVSYARQNKVSNYNNELRTAGYTFLNIFGIFKPYKDVTLTTGVDNLFDKFYSVHLNGLNRVVNSDVEVGRRLPGPGRNFYLTLSYKW